MVVNILKTIIVYAAVDNPVSWDLSADDTFIGVGVTGVVNSFGTILSVQIVGTDTNMYIEGEVSGRSAYGKSTCPWYNTATSTGQKLIAYPWRMYDAIYNTFIRNLRNNPLYDIRNSCNTIGQLVACRGFIERKILHLCNTVG